MFQIQPSGRNDIPRLLAPELLTRTDFDQISVDLGAAIFSARKSGLVAARRSNEPERVETKWNGKESSDVAASGDWIITNLSPAGEPLRDRDGNTNV
ncbi:MAG TPA: hypothetical protein VMX97_13960, partial [Hyphomicrobiaceae bacterium]|nr:hypothetical protein [Hyphomicrobiaceae bacterium]